jgi:TPR repeat protein
MPWITHFDPDPPARSSIFVRGVVGGIILCALLGSAAWFGLRQHVWQNSPISIGNPLATDPVTSSPIPAGPVGSQQTLPPADVADGNAANSVQPGQAQAATPSARPNVQANRNLQPDPDKGAADTSAAEPKAATAPVASASSQRPSPPSPSAERAPATNLSARSGSPEPGPQQIGKAAASQPPLAADSGESQLILARQYLDGHAHPRNPTVASQLLWSAVEKGNSAAEMDLADLYLRGDGVAKNCDQARVLLSVASGKGNTEAMQKLSELNRTGCR